MSGGTQSSLTKHEVEWFEKLGRLIGEAKFFATCSGQAQEAKERYDDIQKKLGEISKTLRGATSDLVKEFEQLNGLLEQALKSDNAKVAVDAKTKLGLLRERVVERHRVFTTERLAFLEAAELSHKPLEELTKSSPSRASEHGSRGKQIFQQVDGSQENTVDTYRKATGELQELAKTIVVDQQQAALVIEQWESVKSKVTDRLSKAQSVLTLEQSQAFAERQRQAVANYVVDHDALKDFGELEKVWNEIDVATKKQEELKRRFEESKEQVEQRLPTFRGLASPTLYSEALQKYGEANNLARLNQYEEARKLMALLNNAMVFQISGKEKEKSEWGEFRDEKLKAINKAIDVEKQKDSGRWKQTWEEYFVANLKGDIEYGEWLGDHMKDYTTARKRLEEILQQIPTIQKDFESKDTLVQEAAKTAGPFMKRCVDVADKLDLVLAKLGEDKDVARQSLGTLPGDLDRARELPKSSTERGGFKLGEALILSLKEGEVLLRSVETELDRLLDEGNSEGQQKLKELVSLKDIWAQHKLAADEHLRLKQKWQTDRKTTSDALDELAQLGGAKYLGLLDEFELAESIATRANIQFQEFLALYPDAREVESHANVKQEAVEKYQQATTAVGKSLTDKVAKELLVVGGQLTAAKEELKRVKGLLESQLRNEKWFTFGNSASSDFRTRIRQQGEQFAAYVDSGNVGAIQDATKLLLGLVKQMEGLVSGGELDGFNRVVEKITELKKKIDSETLKTCKPAVQAKLSTQLEKDISVNARNVWHTEGLSLLTAFENDLVTPAVNEADRIHKARERLPILQKSVTTHLTTLAKQMNAIVGAGYTFPLEPPNCGEFTKQLAGLVQVIQNNEVAGVVEGALKKLQELEKQVSELAAKEPADLTDVASAADKSIKDQEEADKLLKERKQKALDALSLFETTELKLVKEKSTDEEKIKLIESLIKTARKSAEGDQVLTAEEQLHSLKLMAKDALLSGEGRKLEKLAPRGAEWQQQVETVNKQLTLLKSAVEKAWTEDQNLDQTLVKDIIQKLPAELDFAAKDLGADLKIVDEATLPIPDRKSARERLLKMLREYRQELTGNPVYQHLRENPFDVQVATVGLLQNLSNFETKVLTTL